MGHHSPLPRAAISGSLGFSRVGMAEPWREAGWSRWVLGVLGWGALVYCPPSLCATPDICISCGSLNVTLEHPLFIGGMCQNCKVRAERWRSHSPTQGYGVGGSH